MKQQSPESLRQSGLMFGSIVIVGLSVMTACLIHKKCEVRLLAYGLYAKLLKKTEMSNNDFYLQLKKEEADVLETLAALRVLIKRYEAGNAGKELNTSGSAAQNTEIKPIKYSTEEDVETKFDASWSIVKKLLFSLRLLKMGTSRSVAEKTYEFDQSRTLDQWLDDSRFYLSKYYRENKLIVIKDDSVRGNVYAFPVNK